jgi:predicted nucleic acid-binding protein
VTLVFAEDTLEELYAVIEETFRGHRDLPTALRLLEAVLGTGGFIARREYHASVAEWAARLRDPTDAPLAAAAVVAKAEGLVTGDRDFLDLGHLGPIRILRTKQLLGLLANRS